MESEIGFERRKQERFSLKVLAFVQTGTSGAENVFTLSTQDISSGGAFFPMEVPLPTGEKVKITIYLSISPVEPVVDLPGSVKIITDGEVVRSTPQGLAVAFGRHYTISPATT